MNVKDRTILLKKNGEGIISNIACSKTNRLRYSSFILGHWVATGQYAVANRRYAVMFKPLW